MLFLQMIATIMGRGCVIIGSMHQVPSTSRITRTMPEDEVDTRTTGGGGLIAMVVHTAKVHILVNEGWGISLSTGNELIGKVFFKISAPTFLLCRAHMEAFRPRTTKDADFKTFDLPFDDDDGGWAGHHDEVDYSQEVVFVDSDDETGGEQKSGSRSGERGISDPRKTSKSHNIEVCLHWFCLWCWL